MSKPEREPKDGVVTILKSTPSEKEIVLNIKQHDSVRWLGEDMAYELWFEDAAWNFKQSWDKTSTGYKIIEVKQGKHTQKYTLEDDDAAPGTKTSHPYDIRKATATNQSGPPNGPIVWGEG